MNALAALDNLSLAGNTEERSRQRRYSQREQPRKSRLHCGPWNESEFHVAFSFWYFVDHWILLGLP
jgi:hypothetical protein